MMKLWEQSTRHPKGSKELVNGLSNYSRSTYKNLPLWVFGEAIAAVLFYALITHLPEFAQVIIFLVAIVVIWYEVDFPKRTIKAAPQLLFWLPIALQGLPNERT
jgi:hypothetical protein